MRLVRLAVFAACLALLVIVAGNLAAARHKPVRAAAGSCVDDGAGNVTCVDKAWRCSTAVALNSVTSTIHNGVNAEGIQLESGCSGTIGAVNVTTGAADGIKVGAFAGGQLTPLDIYGGSVTCNGRNGTTHQDGVQLIGGSYITFHDLVIKCQTANNSQVTISEGAGNQQVPDHILFVGGSSDPQGVGSYDLSVGHSSNSGFENFTTLSNSHRSDAYTAADAVNPDWTNDSFFQPCHANLPVPGC